MNFGSFLDASVCPNSLQMAYELETLAEHEFLGGAEIEIPNLDRKGFSYLERENDCPHVRATDSYSVFQENDFMHQVDLEHNHLQELSGEHLSNYFETSEECPSTFSKMPCMNALPAYTEPLDKEFFAKGKSR